ncbi:MAG: acyclic terpene utilization AtuA family protein [Deferribacterota bacterium]|nr:acyclic terpene utilization AtuA family protein [Deferribacterota bacterium]
MSVKKVSIGSGSMMWGDIIEPGLEMIEKADIDYICYDWLAEVTMSILYIQKTKYKNAGYPPKLIEWMRRVIPLAKQKGIRIITNGGGANVDATCLALKDILYNKGIRGVKIGSIIGDDIISDIDNFRKEGIKFTNLDTGQEDIDSIKDSIAGAYVYLGAEGIVECLEKGADIIIGGRLADNALYVGPWMYEFGWDYNNSDHHGKIGAAITCGHIIECSCCCTGGMMCSQWDKVPEPWNVGYPIAELYENGEAVITKTPDTGGLINSWTVKEHLLYEVHDPKNYIMPDGIADFTTLNLEDIDNNRVKITNMSGKERPSMLKVGIGYKDGWKQELQHWFCWPDALKKAKHCEYILHEWLKRQEIKVEKLQIDYMGINMAHQSLVKIPDINEAKDLPEVGIRICAKFRTKKEAEYFREHAMIWSAPQAGYVFNTTTPPAKPVRIIRLWPTLIPRDLVSFKTNIIEV